MKSTDLTVLCAWLCRVYYKQTAKPNLDEAREFAHGVRSAVPGKMLAYNLSPSFNWVSQHTRRLAHQVELELMRVMSLPSTGCCWFDPI